MSIPGNNSNVVDVLPQTFMERRQHQRHDFLVNAINMITGRALDPPCYRRIS